MDTYSAETQAVAVDDVFGLATWNRPRSSDELRAFINTHDSRLPDDVVID